ncbi:hypothetical protein EJ02DRAFT_350135, partial [Clathrospora elynae]
LDSEKKSVRLLELLPGRDSEPISCKLHVCDLDETPSYIALSYMWNQGGHHKYIECQGTKMRVGENLWNFLWQYRRRFSIKQHGEKELVQAARLWIDAACINQKDTEERSHQVSLMRYIYMGANSVIAWLGLAQRFEELAFLLTRYPTLLKVDEMYTALVDLLNKTYWTRVWVVQEFILAKSVEIWCGEFEADAASFESVWRDGNLLVEMPLLSQKMTSSRGWPLFQYRREFRHSRKYKREVMGRRNSKTLKATFRLRDLLQSFASSQSTEVYDKIYGFLGIASTTRGERIRPDYSKSRLDLLVAVLFDQCHNAVKRDYDDNYKFLTFLMSTLKVSRMELARYILHRKDTTQPHVYALAAASFMVASVSFVSTICDVGSFVDHAEAFQESTWKTTWSRSSMHAKSLYFQDIQDLGDIVKLPEASLALSFAEPHVPGGNPGPSEKVRQAVIEESTDLLIQSIFRPTTYWTSDGDVKDVQINNKNLRKMFFRSMVSSGELQLAARGELTRRDTNHRYEKYTTFMGTDGITGLACVGGGQSTHETAVGDRICVFSGVTESSNAFIVRLDSTGKWIIVGFAVVLFPESHSPPTSWKTEKMMCFHCHLTDLLELQRCQILNDLQMDHMLKQTLRGESDDEVHRCKPEAGVHDILEFGL